MKLTILYIQGEDYLVGQVKEYPGAITQASSMEELLERIKDALLLLMEWDTDMLDNFEFVFEESDDL